MKTTFIRWTIDKPWQSIGLALVLSIILCSGVRFLHVEDDIMKMLPQDLRWYFTEFDPFAPDCKFSDCTHTHEPQCAVKQALEQGNILESRYQSYCRLLQSLQEQ